MVRAINYLRDAQLDRSSVDIVQRCAISLGQTALCLSGGGALALYHFGVVEGMIRAKVLPRVISGSSGGSIVAAILAVHTDEEMLNEVLKPSLATRTSFIPSFRQQLRNWLSTGYLLDGDDFEMQMKANIGDMTFEEAYAKTGRVVCVQVTIANGALRHGTSLVCCHVTTPHLLIRSAVRASSAVPPLLSASPLLVKDPATGKISPTFFEDRVVHCIDGSFSADIPHTRLEQLFGVTQTIVSQVNPHVVALLGLTRDQTRFGNTLISDLVSDMHFRLQSLGRDLKLTRFSFFQDLLRVGAQRYTGDITLLPWGSDPDDPSELAAVRTPTEATLAHFLRVGRQCAYKQCSHIRQATCIELALAECLAAHKMRSVKDLGSAPPHATISRPAHQRNKSCGGLQRKCCGFVGDALELQRLPPVCAQEASLRNKRRLHRERTAVLFTTERPQQAALWSIRVKPGPVCDELGAQPMYAVEVLSSASDQQDGVHCRSLSELRELHAALRNQEPEWLPAILPVRPDEAGSEEAVERYLNIVLAVFRSAEAPAELTNFLGLNRREMSQLRM